MEHLARKLVSLWLGSQPMYNTSAPETAVCPYIVFSISLSRGRTFTEKLSNALIRFNVYSSQSSSREVYDVLKALGDTYDETDITIMGYDGEASLIKENENVLKEPDTNNWLGTQLYRVELEKSK